MSAMKMMSRCHGLAAILVVASVAPAGAAESVPAPRRVMSLSLCSDQLLLSLLPPERITSVTWLARDSGSSYHAAAASRIPVNYGTAEEVFAQNPDLVVAGLYSTFAARMVLKRANIPLVELPPAENFIQIRETTRMIAREVGAVEKGEKLLRKMDATLADLAATAPARPIMVASWSGSGAVPGKGTLFDEVLRAAGGVNVAATWTGAALGSFDVEQVLEARPDILAYGDATVDKPSLRSEQARHPAIRRFYANRQIVYPSSLYSCGVPQSADAAVLLRREMLKLVAPAGGG